MKSFVVFAAVLACACAKPQFLAYNPGYFGYSTLGGVPVAYNGVHALTYSGVPAVTYSAPAVVAPAYTKTQYHAQDELGQSSHGYAYPGQAAAEARDALGNVRGSYAYIDPNGKEVRVNYVADHNGFRAESNALPVAPVASGLVGPAPVQDTPEVVEARAAHARAFEAAAKAAAEQPERRKKRAAVFAAPLTYTTAVAAPAVHYATAPAYYTAAAAPVTYTAAAAPVTYTTAPVAYTAAVPTVGLRPATLTTVHNNPGHAVSYRVD